MTWVDPVVLSTSFDTSDIPTQANFDSLFNDLLSIYHPIDTTTADNDVNTTALETTLYSVTIPANSLGSTGVAMMLVRGDYLYNNNTANTLQIRCKFGGTTIIDSGAVAGINTLSASRFGWGLLLHLANRGATNAQLMSADFNYARTNTIINPGGGYFGGFQNATSAIDTTVDQTLLISIQWGTSSANNSWRRRWAQVLLGQN